MESQGLPLSLGQDGDDLLCCNVRDHNERHIQTEQSKKQFHELDVVAQKSWPMTMPLKNSFIFKEAQPSEVVLATPSRNLELHQAHP